MPTNRLRRRVGRRGPLPEGIRDFLQTGSATSWCDLLVHHLAQPRPGLPDDGRSWWDEFGAEVVADWIRDHPGRRPWCWWRFSPLVVEARRVLRGTELRVLESGLWHAQQNFGAPQFQTQRPEELPLLEGESVYLQRLGLLEPGEKPDPRTLLPVEFDAWETLEEEEAQ